MADIAYISFDQVPAPKGASTHIEAFVRGLAREFGGVDLVTVGASITPPEALQIWDGVMQWQLPAVGATLIDRVLCFGKSLTRWLQTRRYRVIHFRSNFEGLPILNARRNESLVFEVNGLPSVELKYRYPGSEDDRDLMRKMVAQERACIAAADRIVTPSQVTRRFLVESRGAAAERIRVIPNGADTQLFSPNSAHKTAGPMKLLYFGTLSAWQGVELAIRAVAQTNSLLRVFGTGSRHRVDSLANLAARVGVEDRVAVSPAVSQATLAKELAACDAVLAPLLWNDRNAIQGCCPLKVLEGMAAGRPVIASAMDVVRELGRHEEHLLLCKPGSVGDLANAIQRLRGDPALASKLATNGRRLVEQHFTWQQAVASLVSVYREIMPETLPLEPAAAVRVPVRS